MLHEIKAPQFYTDIGLKKTLFIPPVNGKSQVLFKAFDCFHFSRQIYFSKTFQDNPVYSSTFQACASPAFNAI